MGCVGAGGLDDPVCILVKGSKPVFQPGSQVPQLLVCAGWRKATGRISQPVVLLLFLAVSSPQGAISKAKPRPTSLPRHARTPYPTLKPPKSAAVTGQEYDREPRPPGQGRQHCSERTFCCLQAVKGRCRPHSCLAASHHHGCRLLTQ